MAKTRIEIQEALDSVRAAIKSAESAQSYQTGLGSGRTMASLQTLYKREKELESELAALDVPNSYAGMVRTTGRRVR